MTFSTMYVYVVVAMMDSLKPILNLCTLAMFHLHAKEPTCMHLTFYKKLLKPIIGIWDLFHSLVNLFMKVERNPKDHFIIISSRVMKQVK
jgi:hypothetical protein